MKKLLMIILTFASALTAMEGRGDIRGTVIDKVTLEALPGANIVVIGTNYGATTDVDGNYIIAGLDAGLYTVKVSFIGYDPVIKSDISVNSARPTEMNFELNESVIELEGVTVSTSYYEKNPNELVSVKEFSYEEIRRAPGGFEDVVRALSVLPGVAQQSAGRNDLVVRGGAPSENLYVVDGFVVPNINHFGTQGATGGPLSFINLDFVNNTTFSTGGFSAKYGDKLSSVLNIDLRNGREDRVGGKAIISATQFGLNLEGPVVENSSFIVSARRSYLDFIFNAAGFNFVPEYWDLLTKFDYDINNNNKLSYLFVGAFDRVKFNNNDMEDQIDNARILGSDQDQYVTGISWKHLFGTGFLNVGLSRNYVDYFSYQNDENLNPVFRNNSVEAENELKADLVLKLSAGSELNAGISGKLIKVDSDIYFPSYFTTTFGETLPVNRINRADYYHKYAAYTQFSALLTDKLRVNLGARADYFSELEERFYISPRFSAGYSLSDVSSLSFSAGIYHQFPSYIWLVFDGNTSLKAVNVNQYILGYEHLLRSDTRMKIEGFYKQYNDYPASALRPYLVLANTGAGYAGAEDNFTTFGLEPLLSEGKGNSRGIEFSVQKKSSDLPWYGIFSLTYSETMFTALDGVERPGKYDQKWILSMSGGYIFNEKWEASMKFRFSTGSPYTPYNNDGSQSVPLYLSERFSPIHSLDLRVDRRWDFDGWSLITYIDVQNVYNMKMVTNIRWNREEMKEETNSSIGVLPSIGVNLEF